MASHTIKVTGVSSELLDLLDQRIRSQNSVGRSEYIRELIRKDVIDSGSGSRTPPVRPFREILAPIHSDTERQGRGDEEINRDIDDGIREARGAGRSRRNRFAVPEARED
jgi:hypothetical protein